MISFITACVLGLGLFNSEVESTMETETIVHDWECRYIVTECYSCNKVMVHYVDEIIFHEDKSISFIGPDGLVWWVPYPYYTVEENKKIMLAKN